MSEPVLTPEEDAAKRPQPDAGRSAAPPRRASMFADPAVRTMAWVAFGLVVLYLGAIMGALLFGVLGSPAPRTAAERAVGFAEGTVEAGDYSAKALAAQVDALIDVRQFGQAQRVIDSAPKTALGTPSGDLEVSEARLHYAKKDYADAVTASDKAMKTIKTAFEADLKKAGMNSAKSYGIDNNYYSALLIKGLSLQAAGDEKRAVEVYDEYLEHSPQESNVYVNRAACKVKLKDVDGAKADYQEALKYVPDNQNALDGLKKIGATQ